MRKSGLNCSRRRRRRRRRRRTWLFFHSMRPLRFLLHSAWNSFRQTVKTCLQSEREVFLLRQSYSASWSVAVETVHIHLHCVLNQFAHGHLKHTYLVGAPGSTHPSLGHIVCLFDKQSEILSPSELFLEHWSLPPVPAPNTHPASEKTVFYIMNLDYYHDLIIPS